MRNAAVLRCLMILLLLGGLGIVPLPLWAAEIGAVPAGTVSARWPELRTLEVDSFPHQQFPVVRDDLPPEIVEYMRAALQQSPRFQNVNGLHYASPGDGVLELSCGDAKCTFLQTLLIRRRDGRTLWENNTRLRWGNLLGISFFPDVQDLGFLPDYRKAVRQVVLDLERAAMHAQP